MEHGDCLDLLPSIPNASVDAVICDPPYPEIRRAYSRLTEAAWHGLMDEVLGLLLLADLAVGVGEEFVQAADDAEGRIVLKRVRGFGDHLGHRIVGRLKQGQLRRDGLAPQQDVAGGGTNLRVRVGQGVDLDGFLVRQVEPEVHAGEGVGLERRRRVGGNLHDDVRAAASVHEQERNPAEDGVALPPPAAEFVLGHVDGQVLHPADDGAGRLAEPRRPGRIDEDRLRRAEGTRVGHGLQRPDEVAQLVVGEAAGIEPVEQAGRPAAVGLLGDGGVGDHGFPWSVPVMSRCPTSLTRTPPAGG
jgi:hypothetical protein